MVPLISVFSFYILSIYQGLSADGPHPPSGPTAATSDSELAEGDLDDEADEERGAEFDQGDLDFDRQDWSDDADDCPEIFEGYTDGRHHGLNHYHTSRHNGRHQDGRHVMHPYARTRWDIGGWLAKHMPHKVQPVAVNFMYVHP